MKVLVLCDDRWHPAQTPRAGLAPPAQAGYEFEFVEDVSGWSPAQLEAYPLVLLTKSDNIAAANESPWVTGEVEAAFVAYVRQGGGLLVVHSGTVYQHTPELRRLIGGAFDHHPKQCPVTVEAQAGHPLTAGVAAFTEMDEHYFMHFDATDADVFLTSKSEHGTQPAGWTRREGAGRVCVLTPGHNLPVWLHPEFQKLLHHGLVWCATPSIVA